MCSILPTMGRVGCGAAGAAASLRRIYTSFGLVADDAEFDRDVLPRVEAYCAGRRQKGYRKNVFAPLGARARRAIAARWGRAFDE